MGRRVEDRSEYRQTEVEKKLRKNIMNFKRQQLQGNMDTKRHLLLFLGQGHMQNIHRHMGQKNLDIKALWRQLDKVECKSEKNEMLFSKTTTAQLETIQMLFGNNVVASDNVTRGMHKMSLH